MNESGPQQPGGTAAETNGGTPWGFFATTGLAAVVVALSFLVVLLVTIGYWFSIALLQPDVDLDHLDAMLDSDLYLSVATCGFVGVCTLTVLLLARLRRGISVQEYLALRLPTGGSLLLWFGIAIAALVAIDTIPVPAGMDTFMDSMIEEYRSADYLALYWFAMVVAAPVAEELLVRGFLFRGWMDSRLRETGTILLTSTIWSLMHIGYSPFELAVIFAYGIVLGYSRSRTGSLLTPILIHIAINLLAMLQVARIAGS